MKRSTVITITGVTALACGLPSLIMICIGALALIGSQMPDVMAINPGNPEQAILSAWLFVGCGAGLLFIPAAVGTFSFRTSEEEAITDLIEPLSYPHLHWLELQKQNC